MLPTFTFLQQLKPEWKPGVHHILREEELPPCYVVVDRLSALEPYISRQQGQAPNLHYVGFIILLLLPNNSMSDLYSVILTLHISYHLSFLSS